MYMYVCLCLYAHMYAHVYVDKNMISYPKEIERNRDVRVSVVDIPVPKSTGA